MFEVIFEVHPRASQWDTYLTIAKSLKPEIEQIRGFLDNVRYKSLTRPGWLLSLSDWEDEKALVRWRTQMKHHTAQEKGRNRVFQDYHLRIGEVFSDQKGASLSNGNPASSPNQIRFDATETGEAKAVTLMNATMQDIPADHKVGSMDASEALPLFGFDPKADTHPGLVAWDVFEAILTPGKFLLLCSWKNNDNAVSSSKLEGNTVDRTRLVRVIRDYGMFDRAEAPQFYPEVEKTEL